MKKSLLCILLVCVLLLGGCTPIYKQPATIVAVSPYVMLHCHGLALWHYSIQSAADWLMLIEKNKEQMENNVILNVAEAQLDRLEEIKPYTEDYVDRKLLKDCLEDLGASTADSTRIDEMLESYESLCARLKGAFRTVIEKGKDTDFNTFHTFFTQYENKLKNNKEIYIAFYELATERLQQMSGKGADKISIEACKLCTKLADSLYQQMQLVQDIHSCMMDIYLTLIDTAKEELNPAGYYQRYQKQLASLTSRLDAFAEEKEATKELAETLTADFSEYEQLLAALQQNLLQVSQINETFGSYINTKNKDVLSDTMDTAVTLNNELFACYGRLSTYYLDALEPMYDITFDE